MKECLIWNCYDLFFTDLNVVVGGIIFVNLVIFQGHWLNPSFLLQCLHTNELTGQKKCLVWKCNGLFFRLEVSESPVLF